MPRVKAHDVLVSREVRCDAAGGPARVDWQGSLPLLSSTAPTVFAGRLGTVRAIRTLPDGRRFATLSVPQWLAGLIDADGISLRCEWSRDGQRPVKAFLLSSNALSPAHFSVTFAAAADADEGRQEAEEWAARRNRRGRPSGGIHSFPEQLAAFDLGDGQEAPPVAFSVAELGDIAAWVEEAKISAMAYAEAKNRCRNLQAR